MIGGDEPYSRTSPSGLPSNEHGDGEDNNYLQTAFHDSTCGASGRTIVLGRRPAKYTRECIAELSKGRLVRLDNEQG
jgi:hypothetical protein